MSLRYWHYAGLYTYHRFIENIPPLHPYHLGSPSWLPLFLFRITKYIYTPTNLLLEQPSSPYFYNLLKLRNRWLFPCTYKTGFTCYTQLFPLTDACGYCFHNNGKWLSQVFFSKWHFNQKITNFAIPKLIKIIAW